jgi:monoamine oxidase
VTGRVVSGAAEPYSGGAYSAARPGQAWPLATAEWDGVGAGDRLYFAGEHTDLTYAGYMEGAIRSGQRVAARLLGRLLPDRNAVS